LICYFNDIYVDHRKAFDNVKHVELLKILEELDINGINRSLIKNLYWNQMSAVKIDGEIGNCKLERH